MHLTDFDYCRKQPLILLIRMKSKQTSDNQLHITFLFRFSFDQKGLVAFQAFIYTAMNFPNEFTSSFLLRSVSRDRLHHKGENRLECFTWNKWLKTSSTTTHKRVWIFICYASDDDVNDDDVNDDDYDYDDINDDDINNDDINNDDQ